MSRVTKMNWRNCSKNKIRLIIFAAGVAMVYLGVERGELVEIFAKASRICLQCIGLG